MTPEEKNDEIEADREEADRQRLLRATVEHYMTTLDRRTRYNMRNRAKRAAQAAKVRAGPAAPPWLTSEQEAEIVAIYQEAIQWEKETGIAHEVDHLVPLHGSHKGVHYVCGLHVVANLRAIPKHLNRERSDRFPTGGQMIEPEKDPLDFDPFAVTGEDEIPF